MDTAWQKKQKRKMRYLYPFYQGFSADLLFFVAIDTLFLSFAKHLTNAQIVSLNGYSLALSMILQYPLMLIINKIGTTASVRIGGGFVLSSAVMFTLGTNYYFMVAAKTIYYIGFTFTNISTVLLKNNLDFLGDSRNFVKVRSQGYTIYSVITMVISFIASPLFNINPYIPMGLCIFFAAATFISTFFFSDISGIGIKKEAEKSEISENTEEKKKFKYTPFLILIIISYGAFFALLNSGQTDGKLFIQDFLNISLDEKKVALIIGYILIVSRIVRVFANMICMKLYKKLKEKVLLIMTSGIFAAVAFIIIGSFISNIVISVIVMGFGYIIFLFIRDPYKISIQDIALNNCEKSIQSSLLTTMEFAFRGVYALLSLIFSRLLENNPIMIVMVVLAVLSIISFLFNIGILFVNNKKAIKEN